MYNKSDTEEKLSYKKNDLLFISTSKPLKKYFDYHIHTFFSDGRSSLEECVCEAIKKGLSEIAFTDHVWRSSDWIGRYVQEIRMLRERYTNIKILIGAEAKAINLKGDVDIKDEDVERLDFLMGSVHKSLPDEANKIFNDLSNLTPKDAISIELDIINAMLNNPRVDVIAHPMRLYYKFFYKTKTNAIFPISSLRKILLSTKIAGKLIELNYNVPNFLDVLRTYCQSSATFILGSDAHIDKDVGNIPYNRIFQICRNEFPLS